VEREACELEEVLVVVGGVRMEAHLAHRRTADDAALRVAEVLVGVHDLLGGLTEAFDDERSRPCVPGSGGEGQEVAAGLPVHRVHAPERQGDEVGQRGRSGATEAGKGDQDTPELECRGRLRNYGCLPIKVISNMPNPGDGDAIRLIGCRGDGKRSTVDLILDVNGNGRDRGTAYDAVRIGMNARDLVVTGDVECGRRHTNPSIHQDIVQALSGRNIYFRNFTSGHPRRGSGPAGGAGGGWYVTWANGRIPTNLIQPLSPRHVQPEPTDRRVGALGREKLGLGFSRSYGIFIGPDARRPVNRNNRVVEY
jgi:hypothetical protein